MDRPDLPQTSHDQKEVMQLVEKAIDVMTVLYDEVVMVVCYGTHGKPRNQV